MKPFLQLAVRPVDLLVLLLLHLHLQCISLTTSEWKSWARATSQVDTPILSRHLRF